MFHLSKRFLSRKTICHSYFDRELYKPLKYLCSNLEPTGPTTNMFYNIRPTEYRMYKKLLFVNNHFIPLNTNIYLQDTENHFQIRRLRTLPENIVNSKEFQEMLNKCLMYDDNNKKNYEIIVHLVRQVAYPDLKNQLVNIHQNDHDFIMTAVLNHENIDGGMKYIYENNNKEVYHTTILNEGEGIIHNNKYFYYDFLPIESLDKQNKGYRDIISFNFKETDLTLKF